MAVARRGRPPPDWQRARQTKIRLLRISGRIPRAARRNPARALLARPSRSAPRGAREEARPRYIT